MSISPPRPQRATRPLVLFLLAAALVTLLVACGQSQPDKATPTPPPDPTDPQHLAARLAGPAVSAGDPSDPAAGFSVDVPFAGSRSVTVQLTWPTGYEGDVELRIDAAALPAGVTVAPAELTVGPDDAPATFVLSASDGVARSDFGTGFEVTVNAVTDDATPEGAVETATADLTVEVQALVTSTANAGPGSLRHLVGVAPSTRADPTVIGFDPVTFSGPTTIALTSSIAVGEHLVVRGPTDDDGRPLVQLDGGGTSDGLVAVKDGIEFTLDSLAFTGSADSAIFNMGHLVMENVVVSGNGAYDDVDGWQIARGGGVYSTLGTLTIRNGRVSGNRAEEGGGIYVAGGTLEVVDSRVEGNLAFNGAGIYNHEPASLALSRTFVITNVAEVDGGGLYNAGDATMDATTVQENQAMSGGGVMVTRPGSLAVTGSLLYDNVATIGMGGGLFTNGQTSFLNSTIAGNRAMRGGGIYSSSNSRAATALRFSTVAWNVSDGDGGGIYAAREVELGASIVAENSSGSGFGGPDIFHHEGSVVSTGHNLLGDDADAGFAPLGSDLVNVASNLDDTPGTYGSSRPQVLVFLGPSPARDAIPLAECTDAAGDPLTTDQRGYPRPGNGSVGDNCDIGAYEATSA